LSLLSSCLLNHRGLLFELWRLFFSVGVGSKGVLSIRRDDNFFVHFSLLGSHLLGGVRGVFGHSILGVGEVLSDCVDTDGCSQKVSVGSEHQFEFGEPSSCEARDEKRSALGLVFGALLEALFGHSSNFLKYLCGLGR
jgi:hypothetical protein